MKKKSRLRFENSEALWDPPKLLRDVLFDDWHSIQLFLAIGSFLHCIVFGEVGDVFRVGEVFFTGVYTVDSG